MKIDIHTHTKKCKSGDAPTREIAPADFCETILATEVGIIAITNHNLFDLDQFDEIMKGLRPDVQVWPGIELDVMEHGLRGHLLVFVSPARADEFSKAVTELTDDSTPDAFTSTIEDVLSKFDFFEPLYIAHYKQKTPNIPDVALEKMKLKRLEMHPTLMSRAKAAPR